MSLATEVIRLQGPLAADALVGKFRLDVPAQVGISAGHELPGHSAGRTPDVSQHLTRVLWS